MVKALRADPETSTWAREKGEVHGGREFRRIWAKAEEGRGGNGRGPPPGESDDDTGEPELDWVELTEDGIATAFAKLHRNALQYCHHTGWYLWTGARWKREESKIAFAWARGLCRRLKRLSQGTDREIAAMAKAATYAAIETIAKADRAFAVTSEVWDTHPLLLATAADTFDLTTIGARRAQQGDMITMQTAVVPAPTPDCPKWLEFLEQATRGDAELVNFLQRWCGYGLTGLTREHALLVLCGPGGNGKSVFADTIKGVMGDYARTAAMDTFTATKGEKHPTDLAMLRGARLVVCNEIEEGQQWAEARVKALTGGGKVSARFMRKDFFEYEPAFKLMIVANHIPRLRHVDEAMMRRVLVTLFTFKPEKPNLNLMDELRVEWPGILRWMLEGCLNWQKHGLRPPPSVQLATAAYFEQQDRFGAWCSECCILSPQLETRPTALLKSFNEWAERNGEHPAGRAEFRAWAVQQPKLQYLERHCRPDCPRHRAWQLPRSAGWRPMMLYTEVTAQHCPSCAIIAPHLRAHHTRIAVYGAAWAVMGIDPSDVATRMARNGGYPPDMLRAWAAGWKS